MTFSEFFELEFPILRYKKKKVGFGFGAEKRSGNEVDVFFNIPACPLMEHTPLRRHKSSADEHNIWLVAVEIAAQDGIMDVGKQPNTILCCWTRAIFFARNAQWMYAPVDHLRGKHEHFMDRAQIQSQPATEAQVPERGGQVLVQAMGARRTGAAAMGVSRTWAAAWIRIKGGERGDATVNIRKSLPWQYPGIASNLAPMWSNTLGYLHYLPSKVAI
ncbi:hypothetical protein B0H13DRAFT_1850121 [Mycena leptocephala]|nr:hypothetical protein B0H13DRAFT_1850121 [Mycena leptocephala]